MKLNVAISPCPNDTFAFHGLLTRTSDAQGLDLSIELLDVQESNERLARGELDVGKASFAQALHLARDYAVLPVGAAIGFGVGPLVVAKSARGLPDGSSRVLAPGADTTATFLLRMLVPHATKIEHVHFARIMPAVARGEADFGLVIHEGRFTFERHGLVCVADLGELWEARTKSPLPLGGLLARKSLGADVQRRIAAAVRTSLTAARHEPARALVTMRRHAQELDDAAIWKHVELYVNELTQELGSRGAAALRVFEEAARAAGLVAPTAPRLAIC